MGFRTMNKAKHRPDKNLKSKFYVFDIETTCLEPTPENFVFGCLYGENYCKIFHSVNDFVEIIKDSRFKNTHIFAHNAEFDLLGVFGNIFENLDDSAIFNGKFISAKYNDITFADSLNIFPTSVAKLGQLYGENKIVNDKIKEGGLTKENLTNEDIEYCIRDCKIIYDLLLKTFENTGGKVKITIGSLALYDYRLRYLDEKIVYNEHCEKFFNSYYGGRTECFKIGTVNAVVYDVNSEYPFAMKYCTFPDPSTLKHEIRCSVEYLDFIMLSHEGCVKCEVLHKESYFGYLPYRDEKTNKLTFPIGRFSGWFNFNELRFAIEKGVVTVLTVDEIVYSQPIDSPFVKFVDTLYNERKNSKDEFERFLLKLKLNNLYGKLATRLKNKSRYYKHIPYEQIEDLENNGTFYKLKIFSESRNDCYLETENTEMKVSYYAIPSFASYITSFARVHLLKALLANEHNNVCYCDTDSVFLENEFIGTIGNELGEFKKEDKIVTAVYGLKNYVAVEGGEIKKIIKGVSKGSKEIAPNTYEKTVYFKTKESLRRNTEAGTKKKVTKVIKNTYDKRDVLSDGNTKPICLI